MAVASYFDELDRALAQAYAVHLRAIIPSVARTLCYGCSVGHPSQLQHDVCLMMDTEERILHCLSEAIQLVDENKILNLFKRITNFDKQSAKPIYIFDEVWRQQMWTYEWRNLVCQEILHLGLE